MTLVSAGPEFVERPRLHQLATGQAVARHSLADLFAGTPVQPADRHGHRHRPRAARDRLRRCAARISRYDTLIYALGSNIDTAAVPGAATPRGRASPGCTPPGSSGRTLRQLADESGRVVVCGGGLTGIETAAELAESFPVAAGGTGQPGRARRVAVGQRPALPRPGFRRARRARAGGRHASKRLRPESSSPTVAAVGFDTCVWAGGFSVPTLARRSGLAVERRRARPGRPDAALGLPSRRVRDRRRGGGRRPMGRAARDGLPLGRIHRAAGGRHRRRAARRPGAETLPATATSTSASASAAGAGWCSSWPPTRRRTTAILTGRRAIAYKNMTLRGAQLLFRWPGPYASRRRHVSPPPGSRVRLPSA